LLSSCKAPPVGKFSPGIRPSSDFTSENGRRQLERGAPSAKPALFIPADEFLNFSAETHLLIDMNLWSWQDKFASYRD